MKVEHKYSILHDYEFNQHIIGLRVIKEHPLLAYRDEDIKHFLELTPYFCDLYLRFIHPMEADLKDKLLIKFRLVNEGELFCSDFQFRFSDPKSQDYIGFLGKSNEDTQNEIKFELDSLIKQYRTEFREYAKEVAKKEFPFHLRKLRKE